MNTFFFLFSFVRMKFVGVWELSIRILVSLIGRFLSPSLPSLLLLHLIHLQSGSFAPNFLYNPNGTFHIFSCKISSEECRVAGNPPHTSKANDFLCHYSSFSAFLSENKFSPTWTIDLSILKYNPFVPLEFMSATDTDISGEYAHGLKAKW